MLTDRLCTGALLTLLSHLYPSAAAVFLGLIILDGYSHWLQMAACVLGGGGSGGQRDRGWGVTKGSGRAQRLAGDRGEGGESECGRRARAWSGSGRGGVAGGRVAREWCALCAAQRDNCTRGGARSGPSAKGIVGSHGRVTWAVLPWPRSWSLPAPLSSTPRLPSPPLQKPLRRRVLPQDLLSQPHSYVLLLAPRADHRVPPQRALLPHPLPPPLPIVDAPGARARCCARHRCRARGGGQAGCVGMAGGGRPPTDGRLGRAVRLKWGRD